MKLSLIFPAYNEADTIIDVLQRFEDYCLKNAIDHELVVVNDGSTDETADRLSAFAAARPTVRVVTHTTNQGYGGALRSGFAAATGDHIFFTDSDGQFQPDDLAQTLTLRGENTIVIGYRKHRVEGLLRRLNAWGWNQWIGAFLHVRVRDLNCAWKLFPRTLLTDVTFTSTGAFINAELLYHARRKKLMVQEIPVRHYPRQSGSPTGAHPRVIIRAFRELAEFRRRRSRSIGDR